MSGINSETEYRWYILHTYSGYENMVKTSLEQLIENNNLQDVIVDIKIPTETVIEDRNGKKKAYEAKVMPCYVFVKLIYSSQIWFMLTNTRGVTGFVGPNGKACCLSDDEVKRLRLEEYVVDFDMSVGDSVTAISGPFEGLIGVIKSIDKPHQKAQVNLNMFGRELSVDMDFIQIEKITNPATLAVTEEE
ncbi:MAG: transcription termination/antitermination protein NusG [Corallococcus sp.]|nr:transcription termination/antitermination protein NusG [Corallococcus sp.]